jgi:hypothetical protein
MMTDTPSEIFGSPKRWPYGAEDRETQQRVLEWARHYGMRYSPAGRCLHWLTQHGQCHEDICHGGEGSYPWMDRLSGWTSGSGPAVLLARPHSVSADDRGGMVAVARDWRLRVEVHSNGWYGQGTVAVWIYRSGGVAGMRLGSRCGWVYAGLWF